MRQYIIAGNWKMNMGISDAETLAKELVEKAGTSEGPEMVLCPTYLALAKVAEVIKGSNLKLGAQDAHWEDDGAYTGKVSVSMLKEAGVEYVILGHSEQRSFFGETDETVNKKVKKVLAAGLKAIVCVGETLEQRESGVTESVVKTQVEGAYAGISAEDAKNTVIAYEPVWAIGTGKTASNEQAQEVHAFIRGLMKGLYSEEVAESVRIQYGGSMKPGNAGDLLGQTDIDGGLIGGAALKADDFIGIINAGK
ncbi:MAG: triose-phosphate isomerase [Fibrobacteria bacterium]|nr:triose-phosphate isomerase [Fibrobacteria bacterium]